MTNDNPAARLLNILEEGKKIDIGAGTKGAWMKVLAVKSTGFESESLLMAKLGQFMLLPHETQALMSQHFPTQSKDMSHCISCIQTGISKQNLSGNWASFISHIDAHTISTLSMSSALLDMKLETKLITTEELDSLKQKVSAILDELIKTDLPSEFKKFMTHYLNKILSSINDYFISGALPILTSLEATLGHAVIDPEFRKTLKDSPIGEKIRGTLGDIANVVTIAAAASGAAAFITKVGLPLLEMS